MQTAASLALIGRVIFGAFFVIAGIRNFAGFGERVKTSATNSTAGSFPSPCWRSASRSSFSAGWR